MAVGIALVLVGVALLVAGLTLVVDIRRVGARVGRIGAVWGSLFGNRAMIGRETSLGRFYGLVVFIVGCGALAAGIERL